MTTRSRWLVLLGIAGLALGILRNQHTLAWMSLTVLLWLFVEWTSFYWRLWRELPFVEIERTINDQSAPPKYLWAGRLVRIRVRLTAVSGTLGPTLLVRDCMPENMQIESGTGDTAVLYRQQEAMFEYTARIRGAGTLRLSGLRVVVQDAHGFFRADRFLACEQTFRVLPAFASAGDLRSTLKQVNAIPLHGIHRLQQTGLGAELLELREYVPGDPPKSIAWKVSARRQTLMTRQYESEVPVRVRMFVDGSISTRVGGYGCRLLDQMIFVAASVAQSAVAAGDPVGATLFDERNSRRIPASGGQKGFYRLLDALSEFADNPSPPRQKLSKQLLTAISTLCSERFPELLDPRVNQRPFMVFPLSPSRQKALQERRLIACILAERYGLRTDHVVDLMHDDNQFAQYAQRMLAEFGVAWMDPLVSVRDRGFHDGMATMELLSKALTDAVATARDNEVYVVMANLLECATNISQLLPALKVALSRHHRVVFVVPTPTFRRPAEDWAVDDPTDVESLLARAEDLRTTELQGRLKQSLHRLGARVSLSGESQAIRMILAETELSRSGRASRAGVGS